MARHAHRRREPTEAERLQLALDLEALAAMNIDDMRKLWSSRLSIPYPPRLRSPEPFRGLLGFRLRTAVEGDISPAVRRQLQNIEARSKAGEKAELLPRLNIGVRLEREWQGVLHEVDVVEGGFRHQGAVYATLSEAARAITGTRWSGPVFFGLRKPTRPRQ